MKYTVDENNCVWIYESETAENPFIKQPHWPDSSPWDAATASAWAEQFIANRLDPTADMAGSTPSQPTIPVEANPDVPVVNMTQTQLNDLIAQAVAKALAG